MVQFTIGEELDIYICTNEYLNTLKQPMKETRRQKHPMHLKPFNLAHFYLLLRSKYSSQIWIINGQFDKQ